MSMMLDRAAFRFAEHFSSDNEEGGTVGFADRIHCRFDTQHIHE